MLRKIFLLIVITFAQYSVFGQIAHEGTPYNWLNKSSQIISDIPVIKTKALNMNAVRKEDALAADNNNRAGRRFGVKRNVDINFFEKGICTDLEDGSKLWQLGVHTPKATSINFTFNEWHIPVGGKVTIWNNDRTEYLGTFTHENNKDYGGFATDLIHADKVYIEYLEPWAAVGKPKIRIENIVHGYRSLQQVSANTIPASGEGFGKSPSCHINVNCGLGKKWQKQKRGVVLILTEGNKACSGSLINNTKNDGTPYLLTATHCFDSEVKAQRIAEAKDFVFIFNYESKNCANGAKEPGRRQSMVGSRIIASTPTEGRNKPLSDMTLLRLNEKVPLSYKPYFNGWDRSGKAPRKGTVGIHHPIGDIKKISIAKKAIKARNNFDFANITDPNDINQRIIPDKTSARWFVLWDKGVTSAGSSGSPLFNADNGLIIGQLQGGGSGCDRDHHFFDQYGVFDFSWKANKRLGKALAPNNSKPPVRLKGYDPNRKSTAKEVLYNDTEIQDDIVLFPNPVKDNLTIGFKLQENQPVIMSILDINGKIISREVINSIKDHTQIINTANFAKGVYLISLKTNKTMIRKRFIVSK